MSNEPLASQTSLVVCLDDLKLKFGFYKNGQAFWTRTKCYESKAVHEHKSPESYRVLDFNTFCLNQGILYDGGYNTECINISVNFRLLYKTKKIGGKIKINIAQLIDNLFGRFLQNIFPSKKIGDFHPSGSV